MSRITPLDPKTAVGPAKDLLDGLQSKLGMVPNLFSALAHSPAALKGYLELSGALAGGALPAPLREQIALTVGESNGCGYCVAAHTTLGRMAGLGDDALLDARRGHSADARAEAALRFAARVLEARGLVSDEDVAAVRAAGFSDGDLVEIVAHVSMNVFTNTFNHVAGTAIDFPAAPELVTV